MKASTTATALALVFSLGLVAAPLAGSAGEQKSKAQSESAQTGAQTGTQTGAQTGTQTGAQTGTQTGAQTGAQTGSQTGAQTGTQTGAQTGTQTGTQAGAMGCDLDGDGMVSAEEARMCAEQQFGEAAGPEGSITAQQFGEVLPGAGDQGGLFSQIDEDGDGEISREEWVNWREQGFAEATRGSQEMPASDFESWHRGDMSGQEGAMGDTSGGVEQRGSGTGTD